MPTVNILRRADEHAALELMPVPALCVRGPWAVTPSDDKECPGFAVTFIPTGKKVWPNEPGSAGLLRAKELAEALEKVLADLREAQYEASRPRFGEGSSEPGFEGWDYMDV